MPGLVLISGRPRCGKSLAGKAIASALGCDVFAVSDHLKAMTHRHFGLPESTPVEVFEDVKDEPRAEFGGMTPRQAYIFVSENVIKPLHGEDYLGRLAAHRLERSLFPIAVVSGVGFLAEVRPLIDVTGAQNTLHIRVWPAIAGGSAPDDSRETLELAAFGLDEIDVVNDFTPAFRDEVQALVVDRFKEATELAIEPEDVQDRMFL